MQPRAVDAWTVEAARRHDVSESLRLLSLLVQDYGAEHEAGERRLPA